MYPLLLAALLLGQSSCRGAACPSPATFAGPSYAVPTQYIPMLARHEIRHEGMILTVEGWDFHDGGNILWEQDRPFNAQALRAARSAKLEAARPKPPAPVVVPAQVGQAPLKAFETNGVVPGFTGMRENHYTAESDDAKRFLIEAHAEAADAGKIHLTVIGDDAERKRVRDDLASHPDLSPFRDRILVQDYKPGDWAVESKLGFQSGIVIQAGKSPSDPKGGKVIYRFKEYPGPAQLAAELRKANPDYKPDLDPGIAPGSSGLCPFGFKKEHWTPLLAAVAAGIVILKRKKGPDRA